MQCHNPAVPSIGEQVERGDRRREQTSAAARRLRLGGLLPPQWPNDRPARNIGWGRGGRRDGRESTRGRGGDGEADKRSSNRLFAFGFWKKTGVSFLRKRSKTMKSFWAQWKRSAASGLAQTTPQPTAPNNRPTNMNRVGQIFFQPTHQNKIP
jgi:hypothetical protein